MASVATGPSMLSFQCRYAAGSVRNSTVVMSHVLHVGATSSRGRRITPVTAPSLSRRHAAGAESARGLLLTVLGELVLPAGGAVWTSAVIDVLGRLGVEEKAARQALMRTAGAGW